MMKILNERISGVKLAFLSYLVYDNHRIIHVLIRVWRHYHKSRVSGMTPVDIAGACFYGRT